MSLCRQDEVTRITELASFDLFEVSPSLAEIEAQTIAAYDLLASEYDSTTHATTRALERLSLRAFADLIDNTSVMSNAKRVLEIGCGTGALSTLLLRSSGGDVEFVFLDSSAKMLDQARARLNDLGTTRAVRYLHSSIISNAICNNSGPFDLIVCGLGDPYFIDCAILNMRRYCGQSASLVVTLPERSWAQAERIYRLKIPINRTRYRLASGLIIYPFSFTYSEDELRGLLLQGGFEALAIWSEPLISEAEQEENRQSRPLGILCALAHVK